MLKSCSPHLPHHQAPSVRHGLCSSDTTAWLGHREPAGWKEGAGRTRSSQGSLGSAVAAPFTAAGNQLSQRHWAPWATRGPRTSPRGCDIWSQWHRETSSVPWQWPSGLGLLLSRILWTTRNPDNKSQSFPDSVRLACEAGHLEPWLTHVKDAPTESSLEATCSHLGRWFIALTSSRLVSTVWKIYTFLHFSTYQSYPPFLPQTSLCWELIYFYHVSFLVILIRERNTPDTLSQVIVVLILQPSVENLGNQSPIMHQVDDTYKTEGPWNLHIWEVILPCRPVNGSLPNLNRMMCCLWFALSLWSVLYKCWDFLLQLIITVTLWFSIYQSVG